MRRLLLTCLASLALYGAVFAGGADRPLSLGMLRLELLQKAAALAAMPSPKLVILAGSNGPYSHSCAVLGAMLAMPCENAGIAVGIGLDDVFARYASLLRPGDIVYMPMELEQYTASAAQYRAAVDGAFLLRHDRDVLRQLPPGRALGALFCCQLADLLEATAEMPLAQLRALDARALLAREYNPQGDRIDNDLAGRNRALLAVAPRPLPQVGEVAAGYGRGLIADFVAAQTRSGVVVIGGLPVEARAQALPASLRAALQAVYTDHGGAFLALTNESQYPPADFFNSADHLAKPCQYAHSIALAALLAAALRRPLHPPPAAAAALAATCPSLRSDDIVVMGNRGSHRSSDGRATIRGIGANLIWNCHAPKAGKSDATGIAQTPDIAPALALFTGNKLKQTPYNATQVVAPLHHLRARS